MVQINMLNINKNVFNVTADTVINVLKEQFQEECLGHYIQLIFLCI